MKLKSCVCIQIAFVAAISILLTDLCSASLASNESKLDFVGKFELPANFKFKKTTVGGISGAVQSLDSGLWYLISDDRGKIQEPRFYSAKVNLSPFSVEFKDVFKLHPREKSKWKKNVLDCEGIAFLPWGNFLISSEGDLNQKPRELPILLDVKPDGAIVRIFDLPDEVLPEKIGRQTKGVQNNRGPEGLASSADQKYIWVALEDSVVQEKDLPHRQIQIWQYEMPEAWVIKPTKKFNYELSESKEKNLFEVRGVSEIFWVHDQVLWVMERSLAISLQGMNHHVQIFEIDLATATEASVQKKLILDLNQSNKKIPNFEAMVRGPQLPDGRSTLMLISDNNFQKSEPTQFWLYSFGEKK